MFTKKVTYKKAGNRCVEIHHHSGDTCHLYFYTNSPEPDNVIGTFVDKKKCQCYGRVSFMWFWRNNNRRKGVLI